MANYCNFQLKIVGAKERAQKLLSYFQSNYHYGDDMTFCEADKHFSRVFDAVVTQEESRSPQEYEIEVEGGCAWSANLCLFQGESTYYEELQQMCQSEGKPCYATHLEEATHDLGVAIEIYAWDEMDGSYEHFIVKNGIIELKENGKLKTVYDEFTEMWVTDWPDIEFSL